MSVWYSVWYGWFNIWVLFIYIWYLLVHKGGLVLRLALLLNDGVASGWTSIRALLHFHVATDLHILVEDQHKNGDVDFLAPRMLIPETKLWHTPAIGIRPPNTPPMPQNVPAKTVQPGSRQSSTGEDLENPPLLT